jgi:hypothetical protein
MHHRILISWSFKNAVPNTFDLKNVSGNVQYTSECPDVSDHFPGATFADSPLPFPDILQEWFQ